MEYFIELISQRTNSKPRKYKKWSYAEKLLVYFLRTYTDMSSNAIASVIGVKEKQVNAQFQHIKNSPYTASVRADADMMGKIAAARVRIKEIYAAD